MFMCSLYCLVFCVYSEFLLLCLSIQSCSWAVLIIGAVTHMLACMWVVVELCMQCIVCWGQCNLDQHHQGISTLVLFIQVSFHKLALDTKIAIWLTAVVNLLSWLLVSTGILNGGFRGKKSFFFCFLVKMNVWMVWTCIYFCNFSATQTPSYRACYILYFWGSYFTSVVGVVCCDVTRGLLHVWWPPTESIIKQRVGIGCSASSVVQTGDPGHCSKCN